SPWELYFDGASRTETGPDGSQRRRAGAGIGSWKNLIILISLTLREPAQIKIEESDWRKPFLDYFNHGILPKDLNRRDWHDRLFEALWAYRVSSYPLNWLNTELSIDAIFYPFFFGLISSFVDATLQIHKNDVFVIFTPFRNETEHYRNEPKENIIDKTKYIHAYGLKIHVVAALRLEKLLCHQSFDSHAQIYAQAADILPLLVFLLLGSEAARPASP
ncbi:hypothetical protein ACJX0J_036589, partial [Zea mays]